MTGTFFTDAMNADDLVLYNRQIMGYDDESLEELKVTKWMTLNILFGKKKFQNLDDLS